MNHSIVFDEFAKIMAEKGLLKTAEKKDESYNVAPSAAGPDTPVEETGYELVETAHPKQIQVAESRLNDGIVENGVETQKIMIDVALRNPRGVIAKLMQTLVKAANLLEEDMSSESLRMAKEVDDFLVVLAQQSQVALGPEAAKTVDFHRLPRLKAAVAEVLNRFGDLDWSTFGFRDKKRDTSSGGQDFMDFGQGGGSSPQDYGESIVNDASKKLKEFLDLPDEIAVSAANKLSQFINQYYKMIRNGIQQSKDWGKDQEEAIAAWDSLKGESDEWLVRGHAPVVPPHKPEQTAPGVASKAPIPSKAPAKHYSVKGDEVKELQEQLGMEPADQDGKFGPKTFAAVMEAANKSGGNNFNLREFLHGSTTLQKGYQGWDMPAVEHAILAVKQHKDTKAEPLIPQKDQVLDPYSAETLAAEKQQKK